MNGKALSEEDVKDMEDILSLSKSKLRAEMKIIEDNPKTSIAKESLTKLVNLKCTIQSVLEYIPNKYIAKSFDQGDEGPGSYFVLGGNFIDMILSPPELIIQSHLYGTEIIRLLDQFISRGNWLIGYNNLDIERRNHINQLYYDKEKGEVHFSGQHNQFQALMILATVEKINRSNEEEYKKIYRPLLNKIYIRNKIGSKTKILYPDPKSDFQALHKSYDSNQIEIMVEVLKSFISDMSDSDNK